MKQTTFLRHMPYALLLTTPFFLTGCEGMNMFSNSGPSSRDYNYDYNKAAPHVPSNAEQSAPVVRRTETTATSLAEPTTKIPSTPKLTTSTTNAAKTTTHEGPTVPNMAPTVGQ
ncbi:MAG: hypothetical protein Q8M03_09495 [Legionella sp.]|nr:hypothetical protein [Legionella sp.]